ncbi:unnamed protein product [Staurois parvus]|uniref:Uncharacterized protein n=1 Tax=Staurois parvus TaxID=386267 RepID=A0ABN9GY93_9NEOB|nr:unnamed protein product [Staurois parvus]
MPISAANQCHLSVAVSAAYQCHQCSLSVPITAASLTHISEEEKNTYLENFITKTMKKHFLKKIFSGFWFKKNKKPRID